MGNNILRGAVEIRAYIGSDDKPISYNIFKQLVGMSLPARKLPGGGVWFAHKEAIDGWFLNHCTLEQDLICSKKLNKGG